MKFSTEDYVLGGVAAFLVAILMLGSCGGGGAASPEALGKVVFEAVKKNDMAAAEKISVNIKDLEFMLDNADIPDDAKAKAKEEIKDKDKELKEDYDKFWEFTMESIKVVGIDPAQMTMGTISVVPETQGKLEAARITIPVSQGDLHGNLLAAGFKHGKWRLMPPIKFNGQ